MKTPSLRNIALRARSGHGIHRSATLDPNLAKHPAGGLQLSEADQRALVAFLKTLTEE